MDSTSYLIWHLSDPKLYSLRQLSNYFYFLYCGFPDAMATVYVGPWVQQPHWTLLVYSLHQIYSQLVERKHCITFAAYFIDHLTVHLTNSLYPTKETEKIFDADSVSDKDFMQIDVTLDDTQIKKLGQMVKVAFRSEEEEFQYSVIYLAISNIQLKEGTCHTEKQGTCLHVAFQYCSKLHSK